MAFENVENYQGDSAAGITERSEISGVKAVVLQTVEQLMRTLTKVGVHEATTDGLILIILNCCNKVNSASLVAEYILRQRGLKRFTPLI